MRSCFVIVMFLLLLTGPFAAAQGAPSSSGSTIDGATSGATLTETGVAPDDVVISIRGFCDQGLLVEGTTAPKSQSAPLKSARADPQTPGESAVPSHPADAKGGDCKTEVTRAQFERLTDALGIGEDRSNKIRTAVRYPEVLIYAQKAQELELEKDPRFQEKVKYTYLQLLWQSFTEDLARKASDISDAEVERQYRQHPEVFEQVDLLRIYVPSERKHPDAPASPAKVEELRVADEAAMKIEAEQIRRKAVAGGDFETLENEAYKFAGYGLDDSPDVKLGMTNRAEMPREYAETVFDLKLGRVSELIAAPQGWHIVKVRSRQTIPLNEAKHLLQRLRLQEAKDSLKAAITADFNNAYFNAPHGMDPAKSSGGQPTD
jgi:hypothetical protein